MLIFRNPGELDPRLISTFGVNIKPQTTSPIGFFGTGLKYALAILLRYEQQVTIYSGAQVLTFDLAVEKIRGEAVPLVRMWVDGEPTLLPFTTHLGATWEPWMAYRELYSNVLDEDGVVLLADDSPASESGWTSICVEGVLLEEIWRNHGSYFLPADTPLWKGSVLEIRSGISEYIYYQGIRAGKLRIPSLFTYNIVHPLELTEDRQIKHPFVADSWIASELVTCKDLDLLREVLSAPGDSYERGIEFPLHVRPSQEFFFVVKALAKEKAQFNPSALGAYRHYDDDSRPEPCTLTGPERHIVEQAQGFVARLFPHMPALVITEERDEPKKIGETIYYPKVALLGGAAKLAEYLVLDCCNHEPGLLARKVLALGEELAGESL